MAATQLNDVELFVCTSMVEYILLILHEIAWRYCCTLPVWDPESSVATTAATAADYPDDKVTLLSATTGRPTSKVVERWISHLLFN